MPSHKYGLPQKFGVANRAQAVATYFEKSESPLSVEWRPSSRACGRRGVRPIVLTMLAKWPRQRTRQGALGVREALTLRDLEPALSTHWITIACSAGSTDSKA